MNLRILGLRRSKIIQEKYKKGNGIPKVFGLISLFASVAMSSTKSVIPEITSFPAKLIHHEERDNDSPENIPNFKTPLVSNIEAGRYTLKFNEATSQPEMMDFVESMRK